MFLKVYFTMNNTNLNPRQGKSLRCLQISSRNANKFSNLFDWKKIHFTYIWNVTCPYFRHEKRCEPADLVRGQFWQKMREFLRPVLIFALYWSTYGLKINQRNLTLIEVNLIVMLSLKYDELYFRSIEGNNFILCS